MTRPAASCLPIPVEMVDLHDAMGAATGRFGPGALDRVAVAALARLEEHGLAHLPIGSLGLHADAARAVAIAIAGAVAGRARAAWGLEELAVEVDRIQPTDVPSGFHTRTLLPHHDAAHSSYLSPSRFDCSDWDWRNRKFAASGYTTTTTHKVIQGIFVEQKGSADSITSYYPLLSILTTAYRWRHGTTPTIAELARYLAQNIERAVASRDTLAIRYLTLPVVLGTHDAVLMCVAPHCAESDLPEDLKIAYPELTALTSACPCGGCAGPSARFFCGSLVKAIGLTWPQFAQAFEHRVHTDTHDLLLANNLTLIHGGINGAADRRLQPMCLVLADAKGDAYEKWLADNWRRRHLAAVLPDLEWPQCS
jgi:hypothetical protein